MLDESMETLPPMVPQLGTQAQSGQPIAVVGAHARPVPEWHCTHEHVDCVAAAKAPDEEQHELRLLEPMAGVCLQRAVPRLLHESDYDGDSDDQVEPEVDVREGEFELRRSRRG